MGNTLGQIIIAGLEFDIFLLSPRWEEKFLDVVQRRLPRLLFDHFPICGVRKRRGDFKFENMWLLRGLWIKGKFGGNLINFIGVPAMC